MRGTAARILVCSIVLALGVQGALAGTRSFFVDPYGSVVADGAFAAIGCCGTGGIVLPDTGNPNFGFGFVIPGGYKANSPIRIDVYWVTTNDSCGIVLEPNYVNRTRPGHPAPLGVTAGLEAEDGSNVLQAPVTNKEGNVKTYTLRPTSDFTQKGGDAILLGFYRSTSNGSDTCTSDLRISGLKIRYRTRK